MLLVQATALGPTLTAFLCLYTAVNHCHKKEVAFRVVIPDEKLHSKLIAAGHNDEEQFRLKETISLTMGSALVQVGKRVSSF